MVAVAQLVEHQTVALSVAGSIPVGHPTVSGNFIMSGSGAVGSALALGARGRQFESDLPDQLFSCRVLVPVAQLDRATDF